MPEDVSVVGFDDIDFAQFAHPALTTVSLSRERLGKLAFAALGRILRSKSREGAEYVVETQLVVRESTAAANISACNTPQPHAGEARQEQATGREVTGTDVRPPDQESACRQEALLKEPPCNDAEQLEA